MRRVTVRPLTKSANRSLTTNSLKRRDVTEERSRKNS
jgi:hypothetical protein